jgi:hypothetical protein
MSQASNKLQQIVNCRITKPKYLSAGSEVSGERQHVASAAFHVAIPSACISTVPWPTCGAADIMENWSPQVDGGAGPRKEQFHDRHGEDRREWIGERFTFPGGEAGTPP